MLAASTFVVGNVGYRTTALVPAFLWPGTLPMPKESDSNFHDIAAQFRTLSEQLKTTTSSAERQDLLKQFRMLLDHADKLSARKMNPES